MPYDLAIMDLHANLNLFLSYELQNITYEIKYLTKHTFYTFKI
ncbi:hypothetical protein DSUL_140016 [Desulfovibrionales bacterium]